MRTATWRRATVGVAGILGVTAAVVLIANSPAAAAKPLARAVLHNAAGAEVGTVVFEGRGHHADEAKIKLALPADAPGLGGYHGLHIHAIGTCTAPAFTSAGGHWNLDPGATHGGHTGDLPSVLISADGTARAEFEMHRFDVDQLFDGDGSAVVLHMGVDNFGNVPIGGGKYEDPNDWYHAPTGTANTGDAGSRYGCGVVEHR
jgi:Cu-Zn family superoxide dismutase